MSAAIRSALRTVADARAAAVSAADALKEKQTEFALVHAPLIADVTRCKAELATAEQNARALILAHYAATQEKKAVVGGEVKLLTVYSYDPEAAFAWAKSVNQFILPESLDVPAFEKAVAVLKLPFVNSSETPQAQLASKLNAADFAEPAPAVESTLTLADVLGGAL